MRGYADLPAAASFVGSGRRRLTVTALAAWLGFAGTAAAQNPPYHPCSTVDNDHACLFKENSTSLFRMPGHIPAINVDVRAGGGGSFFGQAPGGSGAKITGGVVAPAGTMLRMRVAPSTPGHPSGDGGRGGSFGSVFLPAVAAAGGGSTQIAAMDGASVDEVLVWAGGGGGAGSGPSTLNGGGNAGTDGAAGGRNFDAPGALNPQGGRAGSAVGGVFAGGAGGAGGTCFDGDELSSNPGGAGADGGHGGRGGDGQSAHALDHEAGGGGGGGGGAAGGGGGGGGLFCHELGSVFRRVVGGGGGGGANSVAPSVQNPVVGLNTESAPMIALSYAVPEGSSDTEGPETYLEPPGAEAFPQEILGVSTQDFSFFGFDNVSINHFECRLDDAEFETCRSPVDVTAPTAATRSRCGPSTMPATRTLRLRSSSTAWTRSRRRCTSPRRPTSPTPWRTPTSSPSRSTSPRRSRSACSSATSAAALRTAPRSSRSTARTSSSTSSRARAATSGSSRTDEPLPDAALLLQAAGRLPSASLPEGPMTIAFKAVVFRDRVNGAQPQTTGDLTVTLDRVAPQTTIDEAPATDGFVGRDISVAFSGTDVTSGVAGFECRIDDEDFTPCTSRYERQGLSGGAHTFEVRAVDGAHRRDGSPATTSFTVDATPPGTTITDGPPPRTSSRSARLAFTASDTESGVAGTECRAR